MDVTHSVCRWQVSSETRTQTADTAKASSPSPNFLQPNKVCSCCVTAHAHIQIHQLFLHGCSDTDTQAQTLLPVQVHSDAQRKKKQQASLASKKKKKSPCTDIQPGSWRLFHSPLLRARTHTHASAYDEVGAGLLLRCCTGNSLHPWISFFFFFT